MQQEDTTFRHGTAQGTSLHCCLSNYTEREGGIYFGTLVMVATVMVMVATVMDNVTIPHRSRQGLGRRDSWMRRQDTAWMSW